jgi:hypothetical protein
MLNRVLLICIGISVLFMLTACGADSAAGGRLIYMSASSSAGSKTSSSMTASSKAKSGSASSKTSSGKSLSRTSSSKKSSSAESKRTSSASSALAGSSGTAGSQPGADTEPKSDAPSNEYVLPALNSAADAAALYNNAVAKNLSLPGGVKFAYSSNDSLNNKSTSGEVCFNNNYSAPGFCFSSLLNGTDYVFCRSGDDILMYKDGVYSGKQLFSAACVPQYTLSLSPAITGGQITVWRMTVVGTERDLDISLAAPAGDYPALGKIFSLNGTLQSARFVCTVSADGYLTKLSQTFFISGGQRLELDKVYEDLGSIVNCAQ